MAEASGKPSARLDTQPQEDRQDLVKLQKIYLSRMIRKREILDIYTEGNCRVIKGNIVTTNNLKCK